MYEKIAKALIENGYTEGSSYKIAEVLVDYGWSDIREILNTLYED